MKMIDLTRAVLVPKESKLEWDMRRLGWTRRRLLRWYREHAGTILASHERQLRVRETVKALLPECRIVTREMADAARLDGASVVIALGGDNHFVYLSHFLTRAPILGVNADRKRSHGGLLRFDERHLAGLARRLRAGRFTISEWPRLEASVDGRLAGVATSELFLGERQRKHMSRHVLRVGRGPAEEHKSSGLLVCTPAGSTGWYGHYGPRFSAASGPARWALTEPFPRGRRLSLGKGRLRAGQVLRVRSLNDADGVLDVDSLKDVPFHFGQVASIRVSEHPLRVIGMEGL
ncbi:MAG: NAD(+)/NADH kinase [Elusimicrobia bacterium]|nr:NAD(+)/NADH kinase [Elusimicrobiota bacterium]